MTDFILMKRPCELSSHVGRLGGNHRTSYACPPRVRAV
jgi:hypothetical protein